MTKYITVACLVVLLALPACAQLNPAQTVPFDHWAYDAVQQLVDMGIIIGYPDGTFRGNRAMTRYEFAMALSRMLDAVEAMIPAATRGGVGPQGPAGPSGPAGAAGAAGARGADGASGGAGEIDYDQVRAIVNELTKEFSDELADLQRDLDYLQDDVWDLGDRVTALEQEKGPEVTGWIDYRLGLASTVEEHGDQEGKIDSSLGADGEFDNLTAKIGIEGDITDELSGKVVLKVRDTGGLTRATSISQPGTMPVLGTIVAVDTNRPAETVWLDEACLMFPSRVLLDADWTVGRQFQSYGLGLLVNNERSSQQGVRGEFDDAFGLFDWEFFFGGSSYMFDTTGAAAGLSPAGSDDGYLSARAALNRTSWAIGANWLVDGFAKEEGYGADLWLEFWGGRELYVEYAKLATDAGGLEDFGMLGDPTGLMAMVDVWRGGNWALRGYYSDLDACFDPFYSTANPYWEPYGDDYMNVGGVTKPWIPWERWLRNPLAMPNLEVMGGQLDFQVASMPFAVAYYDIGNSSTDWSQTQWSSSYSNDYPLYDTLWSVQTSKTVANGVNVTLTYATQELSPKANTAYRGILDDIQLLVAGVVVSF